MKKVVEFYPNLEEKMHEPNVRSSFLLIFYFYLQVKKFKILSHIGGKDLGLNSGVCSAEIFCCAQNIDPAFLFSYFIFFTFLFNEFWFC